MAKIHIFQSTAKIHTLHLLLQARVPNIPRLFSPVVRTEVHKSPPTSRVVGLARLIFFLLVLGLVAQYSGESQCRGVCCSSDSIRGYARDRQAPRGRSKGLRSSIWAFRCDTAHATRRRYLRVTAECVRVDNVAHARAIYYNNALVVPGGVCVCRECTPATRS